MDTQDETIKKGDWVKYTKDMQNDSCAREVVWSRRGCRTVAITYKEDIPTHADVEELTLIRKGPKKRQYKIYDKWCLSAKALWEALPDQEDGEEVIVELTEVVE
jgi:hypothetical protein